MAHPQTKQVADAIEVFMHQHGFTPFKGSTNWASDTVETIFQAVSEPDRVYIINITRTGQDWLATHVAPRAHINDHGRLIKG